MKEDNYKTRLAMDRDRLTLAGKLSELKDGAESQLSTAEQQLRAAKDQLDALDAVLTTARDQIDVLRGIDVSVLTVAAAIGNLAAALSAEAAAAAAQPANQPAAPTAAQPASPIVTMLGGQTASSVVPYSWEYWVQLAGGDLGLARQMMFEGSGGSALGGAYSYTTTYPSFDVGTNYVQRDMLAQIHEGEAIIPRAYNPAAGGVGSDAVVRQLEAMNARMERIEAASRKTAETLVRVTRDGEGMVTA